MWPGLQKGLTILVDGRLDGPPTHWPPGAAWETFNQEGIEREKLGEAVCLPLPFAFLSVPLHLPQSKLVYITFSVNGCWTEAALAPDSRIVTVQHTSMKAF